MQINQYTNEAFEVNSEDLFDMDQWTGTEYQSAKIKGSTIKSAVTGGMFTQTDSSGNVTGTSLQSLLSTGQGSLVVPADQFKGGDSYQLTMYGEITNVNNAKIEIQLLSGSVLLATTGDISSAALQLNAATGKPWKLTADFVIREVGPAGVAGIMTYGSFETMQDSADRHEGIFFYTYNAADFDTTINNTLSIKVRWNSNNAGNYINSQIAILKKTY